MIERKICWRITRYCNLHCKHCLAGYGTDFIKDINEDQQIESLNKIIASEVTRITWTGGEPTLCASLPNLLAICHQNNIASIITTHGLALRPKIYDALDRKLDKLRFSFDGLEQVHNSIRGGQYFYKAINAMAEAKSKGFIVEANISIMERNVADIPELIIQLEKIGASKIVLLNLMDRESALDNKLTRPSREVYEVLNQNLDTLKTTFPNLTIQLNNYWDESDFYIVIESDGEIFLCSENEPDKSFGFINSPGGTSNLNSALASQTLSHRNTFSLCQQTT
jgi:MoaA/NifB/PqqE/SkfB family radical SAM enzyme